MSCARRRASRACFISIFISFTKLLRRRHSTVCALLVETCDGWPAALYLASLSFRNAPPTSGASTGFTGDDRYLADYLRAEYLSRLHPRELRFLRRTSILAGLSEPLCNAVLQQEGSGAELEKIARANLFLVPLPRGRGWFRFHRLFRDLLLRELAQEEPDLIPTLHRRAADWYEAHGELEPALEHADAAADPARVAYAEPDRGGQVVQAECDGEQQQGKHGLTLPRPHQRVTGATGAAPSSRSSSSLRSRPPP